jgi:hypothetical protein
MPKPDEKPHDRWRIADGRVFSVHPDYYLASCDKCGWVGSSQECGTDYWGDDSDVFCPVCYQSGADIGKVAEAAVKEAAGQGGEAGNG